MPRSGVSSAVRALAVVGVSHEELRAGHEDRQVEARADRQVADVEVSAADGRGDRVHRLGGVEGDAHDPHEGVDRELDPVAGAGREQTALDPADPADGGEHGDVVVERGPLGARARLGSRRLGVLAGQRSLAVAVRHHAVGNAGHEPLDVDAQDVSGLRARHLDRPGDDVRPRPVEVVLEVGLRDRARVTQDLVLADPLAGEVAIGVPALVLEMPSPRGRRAHPPSDPCLQHPRSRAVLGPGTRCPRRRGKPATPARWPPPRWPRWPAAGPGPRSPPTGSRTPPQDHSPCSCSLLPGDRAREPRRRGAGRNRLRP